MNGKKILAGLLIATACYMPIFANSFDEAMAVVKDPYTVYNFYPGEDPAQIESEMDELKDWTKTKTHDQYTDCIFVTYKRTLADGVEQELFFNYMPRREIRFIKVTFKGQSAKEIGKMYFRALSHMKELGYSPRLMHSPTSEDAWIRLDDDGNTLSLYYSSSSKKFEIDKSLKPIAGYYMPWLYQQK